jgi:transposase
VGNDDLIRERFAKLSVHLNERQRRLTAAVDAALLGYGGVTRMARLSGLSRHAIHKGLRELEGEELLPGRVRREGGGRKKLSEKLPRVREELQALVDPSSRGDPMSPLRWTCKSTRQLSAALGQRGYQVSHPVVGRMLKELGYSLQANVKTLEGGQHADRDAQFRYINQQVADFFKAGQPVISVDTKKKELIGRYRNNGKEYQPRGSPEEVKVHDFIDPKEGKAIPYGVYDVGQNVGWVNVGCDHDTAAFAVESIRRWWNAMGTQLYPAARILLICADGGGSNGYRVRLWKTELQSLSTQLGMEISVCHLPPGTSKWNKIEHRLFSHISMNWRGRPLVSHEVVVELITATTTRTGLRIKAELDKGTYPTKIKVTKEQMANINLVPHSFHGEWNYTIKPGTGSAGNL